jgi:hypothetical protein
MRKLTKIILPEVGVGDLKIRPRGDNRCESAKCAPASLSPRQQSAVRSAPCSTPNSRHIRDNRRYRPLGASYDEG